MTSVAHKHIALILAQADCEYRGFPQPLLPPDGVASDWYHDNIDGWPWYIHMAERVLQATGEGQDGNTHALGGTIDSTTMKVTSANGVTGILCSSLGGGYFFRVYDHDANTFLDYELSHVDLQVTINDDDASFYDGDGVLMLDHNPLTLGIKI